MRSPPGRFGLVHLGLGQDRHTASLVPRHPAPEVSDRLAALTAPYTGHQRMTPTYPALAAPSKCSGSSPERTSADRSRGSPRETGRFPPAGSSRRRRSPSRTRRPAGARPAPTPSRQHDHDARSDCRAGPVRGIRWL
ncbi:6-phosphogluconolactonase [Streptomyces sp. NPDC048045]|uniref:6-phosphogluconolactonase n=1 Tax=Streptomyces sp. NPDC048045 TaxID=3154710 RepID=UPI003448B39C